VGVSLADGRLQAPRGRASRGPPQPRLPELVSPGEERSGRVRLGTVVEFDEKFGEGSLRRADHDGGVADPSTFRIQESFWVFFSPEIFPPFASRQQEKQANSLVEWRHLSTRYARFAKRQILPDLATLNHDDLT